MTFVRDADVVFAELRTGLESLTSSGAWDAPVVWSLLADEATVAAILGAPGCGQGVLACDPGVQSGYVLAVQRGGVVAPLASWVLGRRAQAANARVGRQMEPARPPSAPDHRRLVRLALELVDGWPIDGVTFACEDWFAGPNPGTARDIAEGYYFAKAAAQGERLTFRSVAHSTWKKAYLGRGNLSSAVALEGYCRRGFEAHGVQRWDPAGAMDYSDDAAARGIAAWWMETEAT